MFQVSFYQLNISLQVFFWIKLKKTDFAIFNTTLLN